MKTKIQIIQALLDERKINAEEAMILMEKEKEYIYVPQQPYVTWPYTQPYFIHYAPPFPDHVYNPYPNYSTSSELTVSSYLN